MFGRNGLVMTGNMRTDGLRAELERMRAEFEAFRAEVAGRFGGGDVRNLRAVAKEKLDQGANLTRPEAAAFIGVSARKLQRMEGAGQISRCRGFGSLVLFASRDVLRLASANGKGS